MRARRAQEEKARAEREYQERLERNMAEMRERRSMQEKINEVIAPKSQETQDVPIWKLVKDTQSELMRIKRTFITQVTNGMEGDGDALSESSRQFIETLTRLRDLNGKINSGDISTTITIFERNPELIGGKNIKFLIVNGFRNGGVVGYRDVTTALEKAVIGTAYHEPLVKYIETVEKSGLMSMVNETQIKTMDDNSIAQKLGLVNKVDQSPEDIDE